MRTVRTRPVHIGDRFVGLAIESVETNEHRSQEGSRFSALVEPIALVVGASESARAIDMRGEPVDLGALGRDVPALYAELRKHGESPGFAR